eukprot:CAMPEP_0195280556 /NCGR_PEP_ID=MMETSP0707-20130614/187_1 /TAXON_ID=33640 /ORGANISM="Asterionellopsis glacialis, Strain CCMP134" /LENGTH=197 /DNA_ID=CAMNT_0040339309 /DNA_START=96 /DNA_END=689 /DNA_ORIENTATION=+
MTSQQTSSEASPLRPSTKAPITKTALPSMSHPLLTNKYVLSSKSTLRYERIILSQAMAAARGGNGLKTSPQSTVQSTVQSTLQSTLRSLPGVRFDVSTAESETRTSEKRDSSLSSPAEEEPAPKRRRFQRRNSKCPSMFFPELANLSVLASSPSLAPLPLTQESTSQDPFETRELDDVLCTAEDLVRTLKNRRRSRV